MRSEKEMLQLIVDTAQKDERIRAVIMNGSRANPNAPQDIFQDYDIVYIVTDVSLFKSKSSWIDCFGELMVKQLPDDMKDPPPGDDESYTYLMQFADGNRIDLTLYPIAKLQELERDSLSILLLDKDRNIAPYPVPNENSYLPKPPTLKAFLDCCNEFWWVCTYVAKGLWREEIIYAKYMLDQIVREQLMKMLVWQIGIKTEFATNPGKYGKYYRQHLEPELWEMLLKTYSDAGYNHIWDALETMCRLFRIVTHSVAEHFDFPYPEEDEKVSAHLNHVRRLPKTAKEMYSGS